MRFRAATSLFLSSFLFFLPPSPFFHLKTACINCHQGCRNMTLVLFRLGMHDATQPPNKHQRPWHCCHEKILHRKRPPVACECSASKAFPGHPSGASRKGESLLFRVFLIPVVSPFQLSIEGSVRDHNPSLLSSVAAEIAIRSASLPMILRPGRRVNQTTVSAMPDLADSVVMSLGTFGTSLASVWQNRRQGDKRANYSTNPNVHVSALSVCLVFPSAMNNVSMLALGQESTSKSNPPVCKLPACSLRASTGNA